MRLARLRRSGLLLCIPFLTLLVVLALALGSGCDGGSATSGPGGSAGSGGESPGDDAGKPDGQDDPDADPMGIPEVALDPAPPKYWYVDTSPLVLTVVGVNVTHYRWALDDGAWSEEAPIATKLSLTGVAVGWRTLHLSGRNGAGQWQETPLDARFYMATTGTEETACTLAADGGKCDFYIPADPANKHYFAGPKVTKLDWETFMDPAPGATICLQAGTHRTLTFRGFEGTAEHPLTFINCGGKVDIHTMPGDGGGGTLKFDHSRFFRVVGAGSAGAERGITLDTSNAQGGQHGMELYDGASDFEVAFVEVKGATYAGIAARSNVSCEFNRATFTQKNTFLHHNHIHDTEGEGYYIGGSHWDKYPQAAMSGDGTIDCQGTVRYEPELRGVRVYANIVEYSAADCIQISSAFSDEDADTEIYNNVASDCTMGDSAFNSGGMILGSGTGGRIHGNVIKNTKDGVAVFGPGDILFFNNVVQNTTGLGLFAQLRYGTPGKSIVFLNNTFIGCGNFCVHMYADYPSPSSSANGLFNNFLLGATDEPVHFEALPTTCADCRDGGDCACADFKWSQSNNLTAGAASTHFIDAPNGDYCLLASSPGVDAGREVASFGVTTDLLGLPRAVGPVDVGACERQP